MVKHMPYIIAGALLLIMLFFGLESKKEDVIITSHVPASGQAISELTFKTLDGGTLKLSELQGKVVLINFWATWCPPCKEEMPIFEKEYKRCKDKGLEIIAVNMDSSERALSEFLKDKSYSFKVVRPTEELERELKLMGFPTSYLLDREGKVYRIKLGVYRELEKDLKQLLGC